MSRIDALRRRVGATLIDGLFRGVARVGQLHPRARPERHGVTVARDVPYDPTHPTRRLDVWSPASPSRQGPLPALLYVHGGGFRILSKNTHWVMALAFARRGFVVFNIDYRLAPQHPFPAAIEDASLAYAWVCANAERYGADPQRLVLAGESAGANLVTALTVAACYERIEPYARRVYETHVLPRAVLPASGFLQVSDPERFVRRKPKISRFVVDRIEESAHAYVGKHLDDLDAIAMADPLRVIESSDVPTRALPPFFLTCGTADPLLDDTRRLHAALMRVGAHTEVKYYPGEVHAFHAFVFRERARECWRDHYDFLERHVPGI